MADPPRVEPIKLIDDQPIWGDDRRPDLLEMTHFASVLAGVALHTETPFTIGIHGGWGMGKTSTLRLVEHLISSQHRPNVVTVWFNPSQFECEEHPLLPLVAAIVQALDEYLRGAATPARRPQARGPLGVVDDLGRCLRHALGLNVPQCAGGEPDDWLTAAHRTLRALAYASDFELTAGVAKWRVVASRLVDRDFALRQVSSSFEFQAKYQAAFAALKRCSVAAEGEARIIVFVDDLDACRPSYVPKLMQGINLALGHRGFVFCLAMHEDTAESVLAQAYKEDLGAGIEADSEGDVSCHRLARSYLEKLLQLQFIVPDHQPRFPDYLRSLLENVGNPRIVRISDVLAHSTECNPRSAVRLINNLLIDWALWERLFHREQGRYTWSDVEVLTGMVIVRVLHQRLGLKLLRRLTLSDALLRLVLEDRPRLTETADPQERMVLAEDEKAVHAARADQTVIRLLEVHGVKWCQDIELRRLLLDFYQQREASWETPDPQQVIVDRAIRNALGLTPDAPIPERKRKGVATLDLAGQSDFSDAGMPLIASLTGLQWLNLWGTGVTDSGLRYLRELRALEGLDLRFTTIGDAGLEIV
ncbi:MAG: KAP family NTPase, partial [Armatimonadetes bacterium]|nr:KAP family NTPase [Armatimonadota bacterium]